mgnify:CR=1 FL=1
MENKGVYKYDCIKCNKSYIGETACTFKIRHDDHMRAAANGNWSHSGLTEHMRDCSGQIDGPKILETISKKSKWGKKYDMRIKEALYIRRFNTGPWKGMNKDMGSYVTTSQWATVFNGM